MRKARVCQIKLEVDWKSVATGQEVQQGETTAVWNHGGGTGTIWCCISASGAGDFVRIMNAEMCSKILIHYAIPSVKCSVGSGFIDPKVTASAVKAYKDKKKKDGSASPEPRPQYY